MDRTALRAGRQGPPLIVMLAVLAFLLASGGAAGSALSPAEERVASQIRDWLADLRSSDPGAELRIDELRITPLEPDLYRARFELDRRAFDPDGTPHVARWEHTWLVRSGPRDAPAILRIQQRPALSFPGTGPQIVCD